MMLAALMVRFFSEMMRELARLVRLAVLMVKSSPLCNKPLLVMLPEFETEVEVEVEVVVPEVETELLISNLPTEIRLPELVSVIRFKAILPFD